MPSNRDVLNWFREREVGDRVKLGKTALLQKLSDLKVCFDCTIFEKIYFLTLLQISFGVDSIIQQDDGEMSFRIALVTPLMRRCHKLRSAGVMVSNIVYYIEVVLTILFNLL